jgi:hypothetical protein
VLQVVYKCRYQLFCYQHNVTMLQNIYDKFHVMRRPGLEPGSSAWQANILPLNQRRLNFSCLRVGPQTQPKAIFSE